MPASDLQLLIDAAREAGRIATRHMGGALDVTDKPDGAGPVTAADLEVDGALREMLTGARPGYGWLSEETPDTPDRLALPRTFIVDPIDGTRSFIEGKDTWAHSLAVAEHGRITAAVVYLPMMDRLYAAALGGGALLNDAPIHTSAARAIQGASVLATRPNLDPRHWSRGVPDFHRAHRPSLAYRLALVAEGRFDAMLTFRRSWEWDIAAGTLIVAEAGGAATERTGAALHFNSPGARTDGVVAGAPALHADLMARLRRDGA